MENIKNNNESIPKKVNKIDQVGLLGLTAQDHKDVGSSSPDTRMELNPEKTQAELMENAEIFVWIQAQKDMLSELLGDSTNVKNSIDKKLPKYARQVKKSLEYLRSIHKLPPEFEDFDPEMMFEPKETD